MTEKTHQKLSSWIFWRPLKFAFVSFAFMVGVALLYGMTAAYVFHATVAPRMPLVILLTLAFTVAAIMMLRRLPNENLDRRSFVALNNAQTFVVSGLFIISTLVIVANAQQIMLLMMWMEANSNNTFLLVMIAMGLFYLYLAGLFMANVYAKFRRCRAMGIPAGKALCTLPFGFPLLWIPGYVLPEKATRNPALPLRAKWYARLTDWIMSGPVKTAVVLIALILFSGFFFGFNSILLTLSLAVIFAIWGRIVGMEKFRREIGGRYTSFAIIANVVVLVSVISIAVLTTSSRITSVQIQDSAIITQDTNAQ